MLKRIVLVALTSGLAAHAVKTFLQGAERRYHQRHRSHVKGELNRWENEGGQVISPAMPAR
ncbi:MAG: hypothetical protein V4739_07155 [Pseudomonadota bacterium]